MAPLPGPKGIEDVHSLLPAPVTLHACVCLAVCFSHHAAPLRLPLLRSFSLLRGF